mmetsp:Transcript_7454/g.6975  ORF Transcript_7454/g.6975 Transcript_7454/m.6975 type:complete len:239 (-) Transcript_7454:426-1142(-)
MCLFVVVGFPESFNCFVAEPKHPLEHSDPLHRLFIQLLVASFTQVLVFMVVMVLLVFIGFSKIEALFFFMSDDSSLLVASLKAGYWRVRSVEHADCFVVDQTLHGSADLLELLVVVVNVAEVAGASHMGIVGCAQRRTPGLWRPHSVFSDELAHLRLWVDHGVAVSLAFSVEFSKWVLSGVVLHVVVDQELVCVSWSIWSQQSDHSRLVHEGCWVFETDFSSSFSEVLEVSLLLLLNR